MEVPMSIFLHPSDPRGTLTLYQGPMFDVREIIGGIPETEAMQIFRSAAANGEVDCACFNPHGSEGALYWFKEDCLDDNPENFWSGPESESPFHYGMPEAEAHLLHNFNRLR
jgi:hypothetical protein